MSSRCRRTDAFALALVLALLGACDREHRELRGQPLPETGPAHVPLVELQPGVKTAPPSDPRAAQYEGNAYQMSQGQKHFHWFNCDGCHANGGGGMGPALMDEGWRYGARMEDIVATILDGRPNGMPAFRGKVTEQQAWQLAAYVRSLSGNAGRTVVTSRREGLAATPPLTRIEKKKPRSEAPPASESPSPSPSPSPSASPTPPT